jgi:hypothetical protein
MGAKRGKRIRSQRAGAMRVANSMLRDRLDRLSRDEIANLLAKAYLAGQKNERKRIRAGS